MGRFVRKLALKFETQVFGEGLQLLRVFGRDRGGCRDDFLDRQIGRPEGLVDLLGVGHLTLRRFENFAKLVGWAVAPKRIRRLREC